MKTLTINSTVNIFNLLTTSMPCLLPVHQYLAVAEVSEDDGSHCSWCARSTDPHSLVCAEVLCSAELEVLSGAGIAGQHND